MLRSVGKAALVFLFLVPGFAQAEAGREFLNTIELKCVSDGIEEETGHQPSAKYLALLGYAAQHYMKDSDVTSPTERKRYLQSVIERVQAYGFCLSNPLDSKKNSSKVGYGDVNIQNRQLHTNVKNMIIGKGRFINKDGEIQLRMKSDELEEVVKYFGFKKRTDMDNALAVDGWSYLTPAQRQKEFRTNVEKKESSFEGGSSTQSINIFNDKPEGQGLRDCFSQLKQLQTSDTVFKFESDRTKESNEFCNKLVKACSHTFDNEKDGAFCSQSSVHGSKGSVSGSTGGGGENFLENMKIKKNSGGK